MNLALWLERTAALHGERPALFLGEKLVADYAGFYRRAMGLAGALAASGVKPGDRVAMFMKNCPEYLIAFYGIWAAGAVAVPINGKLHAKEAAFILENSGTRLVFVTPDLALGLQEVTDLPLIDVKSAVFSDMCDGESAAIASRAAGDLAWLFYTSGTTGQPKGVCITHRMLALMSFCYLTDADQVRAEDTALYAAPLSHGAGIYNMLHVLKGARHVCPVSGGFDEREIFKLARYHGSVHMFAAPTMVKRMTERARKSGEDGEGLRSVIYAGGPMYLADIVDAVDYFGPIFIQIYGQGECPMGITALSRQNVADRTHPRWRERVNSVGRAQSAVEVAIGDAEGNFLLTGQHGEILVRGDIVMPGYWNNPEATAKTIVDGWLLTGDMGFMDEDGYVTLQDRSKDMIISGGSNIYPREVEEVLLVHPDVAEVSVVGRKNDEWGEDVVAFVVPKAGKYVDDKALDSHCLAQIARFKRPKAYFTLSELPKSNYGKVLKRNLRQILEDMEND